MKTEKIVAQINDLQDGEMKEVSIGKKIGQIYQKVYEKKGVSFRLG